MKLIKLLIGLVVLLIVALVVVGFFADSIAKTAIEKGGSYALGVDTKVNKVDIGFLKGTFAMDGLSVANPEGLGAGNFMELGKGSVGVAASSLRSATVEVPALDLSAIRVNLVQGTKGSNYGKILDNLKRFQSDDGGAGGSGGDAKGEGEDGKRFIVKKLTMSDIVVSVVPVPELKLAAVQVPIDKIELTDIGSDSDTGVLLSELMGIVVESILKRATATGQLPGLIQGALSGQLGQLTGLADAGVEALGGLDGILPGGAKQGVDAAKEALGEGVKEGLKGLGIGR
jgi:hypothetical protein